MGPEKFLDTQQDIIEVVTMLVEIKERVINVLFLKFLCYYSFRR